MHPFHFKLIHRWNWCKTRKTPRKTLSENDALIELWRLWLVNLLEVDSWLSRKADMHCICNSLRRFCSNLSHTHTRTHAHTHSHTRTHARTLSPHTQARKHPQKITRHRYVSVSSRCHAHRALCGWQQTHMSWRYVRRSRLCALGDY
jgi:hypothetical protein